MTKRRVVIAQRFIPEYRSRLFELLKTELDNLDIELQILAGGDAPPNGGSSTSLPWVEPLRIRTLSLAGCQLEYHSVVRAARTADLLICEQDSKTISTVALSLAPSWGKLRIAFWGHGQNRQLSTASISGEFLKAMTTSQVHWFFAYTPGVATELASIGFPESRVTVLRNTIDTRRLRSAVDAKRCGTTRSSARRGLLLGRLYDLKRPQFAIKVADIVRETRDDFTMAVVGSGPLTSEVEASLESRPWMTLSSNLEGAAVAAHLSEADFLICPGMIGLSVVDALSNGIPVVATAGQDHSPEFEYLSDGINSVVLPEGTDARSMSDAIVRLLDDDDFYQALSAGCNPMMSDQMSIEQMASDFAHGIAAAIAAPHRSILDRSRTGWRLTRSTTHRLKRLVDDRRTLQRNNQ